MLTLLLLLTLCSPAAPPQFLVATPAAPIAWPQEAAKPATVEDAVAAIEELREAKAEDYDIGRALMNLAALNDPEGAVALAEMVEDLEGQLRHSAIMALGSCKSDNRDEVLAKLITKSKHQPDRISAAQVMIKTTSGQQWLIKKFSKLKDAPVKAVLIRSLENGEDEEKLLLKAIKDKNPFVRGNALRKVAELGLEKGRKTAMKALKDANLQVRAGAAIACGTYGGTAAFQQMAELSLDARGPELRAGLRRGMRLADDAEEVAVLCKAMLKARKIEGRALIAQSLIEAGKSQPAVAGEAFGKLLHDKDAGIRILALRGIEATAHESSLPMIIELLDHDELLIRSDAVRALSTFSSVPVAHAQKVADMSADPDPVVRLSATMALKPLPQEVAIPALGKRLEDDAWAVRDVAVEALAGMRNMAATRLLADHMQRARGLVKEETYNYLRNLTGQDFGPTAQAWSKWLNDQPDDFQLPTPEEAAQMLVELEAKRSVHEAGYGSVEYHGIAVRPGGVIFILDLSGSMGFNYTPDAQLFHDYFTKELMATIDRLHGEHYFNIVTFNNGATKWKDKLVRADDESKAEAVKYVSKRKPWGGTNLASSLELAFQENEVQQIYLMTDGDPTVGTTLKSAIIDRVVELNRSRRIRIHTIVAGDVDGDFLNELAVLNGGTSVDLRKNFEEEYEEEGESEEAESE